MPRLYLTFILILLFAFDNAQTQYPKAKNTRKEGSMQIKGSVILAATRKPIAGLTVVLDRIATKTDSNGKFVLNVPNTLRGLILYLTAYGKFNNGGVHDSIRIDQELYGDDSKEITMYWMPVDNRKEHVDISAYKIPGSDTAKVTWTIIIN